MITTFCPICHRPYDVSLGECPVCSRQAEAEQQNRKGRKRVSLDGILNARRRLEGEDLEETMLFDRPLLSPDRWEDEEPTEDLLRENWPEEAWPEAEEPEEEEEDENDENFYTNYSAEAEVKNEDEEGFPVEE